MKILKIISIGLVVVYIGLVVLFESWLGYSQPSNQNSLVITTFDDQVAKDRVLSAVNNDGKLYVSANHWPRAWYRQALSNPNVEVNYKGETNSYLAVPVEGKEHDKLKEEHAHPLTFRILTGFPPRYFLRLDLQD
ncbi:MAG TPA: DUF385 domain-containing protein [Gammaproteobacteria bacterium]|jgi:hypothetical protein|nr:DUF385 domain-containing protein [Gammaproteobacteria bacterium]